MRLFVATSLAAVSEASHFRAIGMSITQGSDPNEVVISRSQTWRRGNSGYSGGCIQQDIDNQVVGKADPEDCWNDDNTRCGYTAGGYIVSNIEDTLSTANNFCYGTRNEDFTKPAAGYELEWDDCCWVKFTTDDNVLVSGGSFGILAQVNDRDNNTPQIKLPPIWKIMAGCPAQTIDLNPVDLDGDTIKCRWADSNEGLGAWSGNHNFGSITLDRDTCILTYDGTNDSAPDGVKPIAVQVEDFDANGNVKSSMPIQFLATVWTPGNTNFRTSNRNSAYQFPDLFPVDDESDNDGRKRREARDRRSVPAYCNQVPTLDGPTPAAGAVISVPDSGTSFSLSAVTGNGSITRFTYQSPPGLNCAAVDSNGDVSCTFVPTADQKGTVQNFCFQAEDNLGLTTERRCITLNVGTSMPAPPAPTGLVEIGGMLDIMDPNGNRFVNYGCIGQDAYAANSGKPADDVDKRLQARKKCIRCVTSDVGSKYEPYTFDKNAGCGDAAGTAQRAFCECDKAFVDEQLAAATFDANNANGGAACPDGVPAAGNGNLECCRQSSGAFVGFNSFKECCDAGTIRPVGTC